MWTTLNCEGEYRAGVVTFVRNDTVILTRSRIRRRQAFPVGHLYLASQRALYYHDFFHTVAGLYCHLANVFIPRK